MNTLREKRIREKRKARREKKKLDARSALLKGKPKLGGKNVR